MSKLCSSSEASYLRNEMIESLEDVGGANDRSLCMQIGYDYTHKPYAVKFSSHARLMNLTIHELLSNYDACQNNFSKRRPTYHNYKYEESDVKNLQAKKDFNTSREKYGAYAISLKDSI